jgi:hypothetical protein
MTTVVSRIDITDAGLLKKVLVTLDGFEDSAPPPRVSVA